MASRQFSDEQRAQFAAERVALPDGSYPMPDCDAVGERIGEYPAAPDTHKAQLAALIRRRNAELDCYHDLSALGGADDTEEEDGEAGV